ncbi:hypothetical protein PG990_003566 [Apiospora arundinis]
MGYAAAAETVGVFRSKSTKLCGVVARLTEDMLLKSSDISTSPCCAAAAASLSDSKASTLTLTAVSGSEARRCGLFGGQCDFRGHRDRSPGCGPQRRHCPSLVIGTTVLPLLADGPYPSALLLLSFALLDATGTG